jgi:hypothetical protein
MFNELSKRLAKNKSKDGESKELSANRIPFVESVLYSSIGLYFLLAIVFWSAGRLGRVFFVALSIGMLMIIISSIVKYLFVLANAANHKGGVAWGLLFAKGVFGLAIPLMLMRIVGTMMMQVMPRSHSGLICDVLDVIRSIYWAVDFPRLTLLGFYGSLVLLALFLFAGLRNK